MEDRSPRFRIGQLATRTGVDPERLRKWESRYALMEPERSSGGFRLYSPADERRVRLMQRHLARGYAAAEAAELAREGVVSPAPARLTERLPTAVVGRSRALFRRSLRGYDEAAAQRALDDLFQAFTVDAVLRDAILPFLHELGESWEAGETTPGQEHFASTIISARLLRMTVGWGTGSGRRALLACPAGERHTLALVAFGLALSRRGWRITYLGADTPAASIAHAAETIDPAVVVLAASRRRWFAREADALASIAEKRRLYIAGAGAGNALADRLGAGHLRADPVTAAAEIAAEKRVDPPGAGR
jgi:MerR family transcriptional regulator, light-induced transcriptional regulator